MSLKIIGGRAKGLNLESPKANSTRPTSVLLKRKIFDSYSEFLDCHLIDLCAGSGAFGLEALSRGFAGASFVENSQAVCKTLQTNIQMIQEKIPCSPPKLYQMSALKWMKLFCQGGLKESLLEQRIIFFDPPYQEHNLYKIFIAELENLEPGKNLIWIESDTKKGPDPSVFDDIKKFEVLEKRSLFTHGDSFIKCYKI